MSLVRLFCRRATWICVSATLLTSIVCTSHAQTLHVAPSDARCSAANDDLYCSIQEAIDNAREDAILEIAAGTFDLWGETLTVSTNLTITGAGAGITVLDGGGQHPEPLLAITAGATHVHLKGLSMMNRIRTGSTNMGPGAIDHNGANLTVSDVEISANQGGWGGAVRTRSEFGQIRFENATIRNNTGFTGGAIAFYDGPGASLTIVDSKLTGNNGIFSGGALFLRDVGEITLENVIISGNQTGNTGGGIHVFTVASDSHLDIRNSRITDNTARLTGGVSTAGEDVDIRIEGVTIMENRSDSASEQTDCGAEFDITFETEGANRIGKSCSALLGTSAATTQ